MFASVFLINLKENCKAYFLKHNDDTRFLDIKHYFLE